jgi:cytochrome c553
MGIRTGALRGQHLREDCDQRRSVKCADSKSRIPGLVTDSLKEWFIPMTQDKAERHVIFASVVLMMLFAGLTLFVSSIVRANLGRDSVASTATFRTKCAMCHGPDGRGSAVGRSMTVPDLRSPEVQKHPDDQLAQIISDGKGAMPSFKNSLSEGQIHEMVAYIRSLHHPALVQGGREGIL